MSKTIARVRWNVEEKRYELYIVGILKAYSEPSEALKDVAGLSDEAKHEEGRVLLVKMANEKGYTVVNG